MKILLSLLLIAIYQPTNATELKSLLDSKSFNKICSKAMKFQKVKIPGTSEEKEGYLTARPLFSESGNYLYVVMRDLSSNTKNYKITKLKKGSESKEVSVSVHEKPVRDIIAINNNTLLLLFDDHLVLNNLNENDSVVINIPRSYAFGKNDRAYSMVLKNNTAYVANGTEGIAKINLKTKETSTIDLGLVQSTGHYSIAVSVSMTENSNLIVGIDNLTAPNRKSVPFNGFKKVNTLNNQVFNYPYNKKTSGVLVRVAKTIIDKDTLWINNWGTVQTVNLSKFDKEKAIKANWFRTVVNDETGNWHYQPLGDFFILDNHFYSCAKKTDMDAYTQVKDESVMYKAKIN